MSDPSFMWSYLKKTNDIQKYFNFVLSSFLDISRMEMSSEDKRFLHRKKDIKVVRDVYMYKVRQQFNYIC